MTQSTAEATAEATARAAITKNIKDFERMRDDQTEHIEVMRDDLAAREAIRDEYAGVVMVLKRSLNRF